jgi:hypothetical protein
MKPGTLPIHQLFSGKSIYLTGRKGRSIPKMAISPVAANLKITRRGF